MRFCTAQLCSDCLGNGGRMDEKRCGNRNAKYCESCSQLIRKQQSAEWKRNKRARVGWRAYKEEYYPYADEQEEREYRRDYLKKWRARKRASGS
jgi:hypothetical protein